LSIHVSTLTLVPGAYTTDVEVSDPNAANDPAVLTVVVNLSPFVAKPAFGLGATSVALEAYVNGPTVDHALDLTNSGDAGTTLDWSVASDSPWLVANPASGTTTTETDTVTVTVDASGLASDTHTGALTFSDANATNNPFVVQVQIRAFRTWFVDIDAPAGGNGQSWATAFRHPQEAVDLALDGDEIWVAEGLYTRQEVTDTAVLAVPSAVKIFGGFSGTESRRDERDVLSHEVVLDGEYLCTRVVSAWGNALLDGFTVMRAAGTGNGGGVYIGSASVTVRHCILKWNSAAFGGGLAVVNLGPSDRCYVEDCVFIENSASVYGGGLASRFGEQGRPWPEIVDCTFINNTAPHGGGMAAASDSSPPVKNCLFVGNSATDTGGGFYSYDGAEPILTNCTFVGNRAMGAGGGAIHKDGWWMRADNSIFWGNYAATATDFYFTGPFSSISLDHCCIQQGGFDWVSGLVKDDPLFVDPGYWDDGGTPADESDDIWVNGDYHLRPGSSCIDAANGNAAPATDMDGNVRRDDPGVADTGSGTIAFADMGVYEFRGHSGLLGHWKLDDGGGWDATDSSGRGNHGTLVDMDPATDWVAGKISGALGFDGVDGHVDLVGTGIAVQGNGERTVAVWVKTVASGDLAVMSTGTGSPSNGFDVVLANGIVGVTDGASHFFPATGSAVNDGFWHHVAAVYDGSGTVTTYVDGVPDNVGARSYGTSGQDNFIGKSNRTGSESYFEGTLDDIRAYGQALEPDDIHFLHGSTPLVDAGADHEIALPMTATLAGSIVDDGLPDPPGAVSATWEKVSGAGDVVFADRHALSTTAVFFEADTYVLRLTADDGASVASDDVTITVRPVGYPVVSASAMGPASEAGVVSGTFTITRSGDAAAPLTVSYAISGTADADDYVEALTGTATIPAGETVIDVPITPIADGVLEGTERVELTLATSGDYVVHPERATATLRIMDAEMLPGLVGWWRLDDAAGSVALDSSSSHNDGLLNGPVWTIGVDGGGLSFDGSDDYVDAGAGNLPAGDEPQTVALWLCFPASPPAGVQSAVSMQTAGAAGVVQLGFRSSRLTAWTSGGSSLADTTAPPANEWHHCAYTFDGTVHRLYLNGVLVDTSTTVPNAARPGILRFGHTASWGEHFSGSLDDIRIYDRTLTAAEIDLLARP
jgi:parallel beta-helix repeat protein